MKKNFILNLFGVSTRFWVCTIPLKQFQEFERYRLRSNMDLNDFYINYDVLEFFGLSSWTELPNTQEFSVFPLIAKNKIEIKQANKKILKISADEILAPTLFPIYQFKNANRLIKATKDHQILVIEQQEIGLFAKYELDLIEFNIEKLLFILSDQLEYFAAESLIGLSYNDKVIKLKQQDTLMTSISVRLIS